MRLDFWKLSTLVLAVALAVVLVMPALSSEADAQRVKQPHMRAALSATRSAQRSLKKAAHNKAGHRVKALRLLEKAEAEIKAGMAASAARR